MCTAPLKGKTFDKDFDLSSFSLKKITHLDLLLDLDLLDRDLDLLRDLERLLLDRDLDLDLLNFLFLSKSGSTAAVMRDWASLTLFIASSISLAPVLSIFVVGFMMAFSEWLTLLGGKNIQN